MINKRVIEYYNNITSKAYTKERKLKLRHTAEHKWNRKRILDKLLSKHVFLTMEKQFVTLSPLLSGFQSKLMSSTDTSPFINIYL